MCKSCWQIDFKAAVLRMLKLCNVIRPSHRDYVLALVLEKLMFEMHIASQ